MTSESDEAFVESEWGYLTDGQKREARWQRLFALARCGAEMDAVVAYLGQFQRLSDELSRLRVENIQMQAALGYAFRVEDERHILPSNPFKCLICDARNRAVKDALTPPPAGETSDDKPPAP